MAFRFHKYSFLSLSLRLCISAVIFVPFYQAQSLAPGGPGKDAQWATAGKQGVGTSTTLESKVWFTLAQGALTEVYYPDVTTANVHLLQFVVVNPNTKKVETEQDDAIHEVKVTRPDSLTFQQINIAKSGEWKITKTYVSSSTSSSVIIDVRFDTQNSNLNLYVYFDPSIENSGMHDTGYTDKNTLVSFEKNKSIALAFSSKIAEMTNGFFGSSDGMDELRNFGKIVHQYKKAENGNVVQMARILEPKEFTSVLTIQDIQTTLGIIRFPSSIIARMDAEIAKKRGFAKYLADYEKGWGDYIKTIPKIDPQYQAQFNMAAMQLKAHEDKTHRGANIASLTVPWGGGANANENNVGGYHLVWSRDLYQVATAYMALGDNAAAERALDFVFNVQQKPDGSFPQNSFLDGKPFWGSLQMDEVAYPLILSYQLGRFDKPTYEKHVKPAADFIVRNGPSTPQERWEERPGYSPSTIAAEIAGLVCAADIAKKNGDEASALIWLGAADEWARNVERWTATTTGKYGDGTYYLRITANGKPDAGEKVELNNGAGTFDEREIVDAGFLELVRLGIKPANDPLIAKSIKVIDEQIKVNTPSGPAFYRYNHDGYGEMADGRRWNWDGKYTGQGRPWPLLSGERGQYELAQCRSALPFRPECLASAKSRLDAMVGFGNDSLMIPEQVWDKNEVPANIDRQFIPELKFGEGTGSATPLAWSMAQFIRLTTNLKAGRNLDTPQVVYDRYKNGIPGQTSNFGGNDSEVVLPVKTGERLDFPRDAGKGTKAALQVAGRTYTGENIDKDQLIISFIVPEDGAVAVGGVLAEDGSTGFERVTLRQKPVEQVFSPETIQKIQNSSGHSIIDSDGNPIFFYKGTAKTVTVAGDINGWNPNREFLRQIATNLWAVKLDLSPSARTEYKLVVDGQWILDPLNPNKHSNGVGGENSLFAMPGYKPTPWTQFRISGKTNDRDVAILGAGKIELVKVESAVYGQKEVRVYLPPGLEKQPLPVLYLQDGGDYLNQADAVTIQQNLVTAGKVEPFIMVFLDPKDRMKEYWANDDYAKYVATEVVPAIDKQFKTVNTREGRAIIGASLGGVTSLWVGLKYPEKFARLGAQSSSFWIDNGRVVKELEKLDPATTKFRFYLDDGTLEGADDSRRVNVMLRGKGYQVKYGEGETGHNWTAWRDRLAEAFVELWK